MYTLSRNILFLLLAPGMLAAQAPLPAPPPRLMGASFLAARYRVGASGSLFVAGRIGPGMAVAGIIANPETHYGAFVFGAGTKVRVASNAGATVIAAGASASDGGSLRLYVMPAAGFGRLSVNGITAVYQPISGVNRAQLLVDPLLLSTRVAGGVRLGLAGVYIATDGKLPDYGAGPSMQVRLPGGALSLELVSRTRRMGPELRGAFSAAL